MPPASLFVHPSVDGPASESAVRPALRAIVILIAIAWVFKLVILAMPPDEISPGGLPDNEEMRRGSAAHEWIMGPALDYYEFQQGHFQGGTMLTIALTTASYGVFGESPLTMRFPNLVYDAFFIAFLFLFVRRTVSTRAAWIAGLLAALPPPGYAMVGAIVWASHVEANAFAAALLWLWSRVAFRRDSGLGSHLLLGVLAGVSFWFHYGLVIWLALMVLVEIFAARFSLTPKKFGARLLGVAIGLGPFWVYNLKFDWAGLGVYGKSAAGHFQTDGNSVTETFTRLMNHFLPHSQYLPAWGGAGRVIEWVLYVLVVLTWLFVTAQFFGRVIRRQPVHPAACAVVLYPILWTPLYTFGTFHGQDRWVSGYRYMLPLYPVGWFAIGTVLASASARIRWTATAALLGVSVAGIVPFLRPDYAELNRNGPAFEPESPARLAFYRRGGNAEKMLAYIDRVQEIREPELAERLIYTVGQSYVFYTRDVPVPDHLPPERLAKWITDRDSYRGALEQLLDEVPETFRPYFEPLRGNERPWPWDQRDMFWKQYRRRKN